mgnify:CR=1 FL=1
MARSLDVSRLVDPHSKATEISNRWEQWQSYRRKWLEEKKELRNFVYAVDTRTTSNNNLPWSNSTTTPKITQVYDNLKANYTAALFPARDWMQWVANDKESNTLKKRNIIQAYLETKNRQSDFRNVVDKIVDDYILCGNCFATVDFEYNMTESEDGLAIPGYIGPKLVRISPYDISFDPTAADWASTPKIVRSLKTMGDIQRMVEDGDEGFSKIFDQMKQNRSTIGSSAQTEKSEGFFLMIRRPPRSTLFPHDALPISLRTTTTVHSLRSLPSTETCMTPILANFIATVLSRFVTELMYCQMFLIRHGLALHPSSTLVGGAAQTIYTLWGRLITL